MSNTFFIGDTHFNHANIMKFTDKFDEPLRNFSSVKEHDEYIIDCWNSVVSKRDLVFHLGDVVFASTLEGINKLNGTKQLILGNHDNRKPREYANYFAKVWGMKPYKHGLVLTHAPIHPCSLEFRFSWNIHGHVHSNTLDDDRYINVSCEVIDYTPVSLDQILKTIRERSKKGAFSTRL